jgi:hypothetical protein
VIEKIGKRFPGFHPGHYNGIFSVAMALGLLAPATLGFLALLWGVRVAMWLPLAGSVVVFFLLVLLWTETRFAEARTRSAT